MKIKVKNACAGSLVLPELKLERGEERVVEATSAIWNYFNLHYIKIELLGEEFPKPKKLNKENKNG